MTKIEQLKAAHAASASGEWATSRHATPESHPQFGVYADGATNDLAIVRGGGNATFIAQAHNLMPQLLEGIKLIKRVVADYDDTGCDGCGTIDNDLRTQCERLLEALT